MRRSPIRHKVRSHTRMIKGKTVQVETFYRGTGRRVSPRPRKRPKKLMNKYSIIVTKKEIWGDATWDLKNGKLIILVKKGHEDDQTLINHEIREFRETKRFMGRHYGRPTEKVERARRILDDNVPGWIMESRKWIKIALKDKKFSPEAIQLADRFVVAAEKAHDIAESIYPTIPKGVKVTR